MINTLYLKHLGYRFLGSRYQASTWQVEQYKKNPDNTFLVSYSRTGSHWLRLLIELYFERPLLPRTFYFPHKHNYLLFHTHDMDLQEKNKNVIYLYRDPVDTIYSQLCYYGEPIDNLTAILHWTHLYACHLAKWLVDETFTTRKTIVRYEGLTTDIVTEFGKIVRHFEEEYDSSKLQKCAAIVSKERITRETLHDPKVINLEQDYQDKRSYFQNRYTGLIWGILADVSIKVYNKAQIIAEFFSDNKKDVQSYEPK